MIPLRIEQKITAVLHNNSTICPLHKSKYKPESELCVSLVCNIKCIYKFPGSNKTDSRQRSNDIPSGKQTDGQVNSWIVLLNLNAAQSIDPHARFDKRGSIQIQSQRPTSFEDNRARGFDIQRSFRALCGPTTITLTRKITDFRTFGSIILNGIVL